MASSPARVGAPVLTFLIALVTGACSSGGKAGQKAVHPVTGKVLFKDRPAAGAFVVFVPANEPPEPVDPRPHATVQPDGTFQLSTFGTDDGAPEGEYAVIVTWPAEDRDGPEDKFSGRYANPKRPVTTVTVKAGKNELDPFVLK